MVENFFEYIRNEILIELQRKSERRNCRGELIRLRGPLFIAEGKLGNCIFGP